MTSTGSFILFPCPISEGKNESLSSETIQMLHATTHFIVERAKTARHFIKSTHHPIPLPQLEIMEISDDKREMEEFMNKVLTGVNIGILSEAGCPGIADPGAEVVSWAHQRDVRVIPLVGPSSILMALMASGFSGQNFAFNGYLSNKKPELIQQLKGLETKVKNTGQTQIFMETPYRNGFMIECCVQTLEPTTRLCIACDINGPTEDIRQMTIKKWRSASTAVYHKRPCIYVLG